MVKQSMLWRCLALGVISGISWGSMPHPAVWAQDAVNPAVLESPESTTQTSQTGELALPFTDVSPDHWAYQALLNLAGTYGCVRGYPDGTFRGEAPVTRYEFAAGLDSCLGAVLGLIEQQQGTQQREVDALIDAMEQSLEELRQLEQEVGN